MSRYRKVSIYIWNDGRFRSFTDDGKLAFLFLLTHPHMTAVGAMRGSIDGLAAELGWKAARLREALRKALQEGMLQLDEKASILWLPKFLRHNRPESPNVIKAWASALESLPECAIKASVIKSLTPAISGMSEAFRKALERLLEGFDKGMPNQEQEQEQEQEQDNPQTPKGDVSEMPLPMLLNTARFRSAWREWVAYRKEIRKPLKPTTAEKQLEALSKYGVDLAIEKIQTAITNGWQGVVFQGDNKRRFAADEDNLPCYRPAAEVLAEQKLRG